MMGIKNMTFTALFVTLFVFTSYTHAEDPKECEVCVKVINDLKETYTKNLDEKKDAKKLPLAESTLEKWCGSKQLAQKDKKLCYSLLPMKKDAARQISYNKESMKICKSLSKKNPDFCSMRYPVKTDINTDYSKLRVKQLKKILGERGVECVGCVEKDDFIKKIKDTQHMEL